MSVQRPRRCSTAKRKIFADEAAEVSSDEDSDFGDIDEADDDSDYSDEEVKLEQGSPPSFEPRTRETYVWRAEPRAPRVDQFTGQQGPSSDVVVADPENPLHYFQLVFDDALFDILVTETNRHAAQTRQTQPMSPSARINDWKPVTVQEMKVFLGLVLLTGIVRKGGSVAGYWAQEGCIATPYFGQCMSRNRFMLITAMLHFTNNAAIPKENQDRLVKIRPVYDHLVSKWRSLYSLGEHISIDEGMLKWRGRLSFRVYNKAKPIKYGIKSYILADSTSYYCWNMDIYHGEKKTLKETVWRLLTDSCLDRWHSLYMDNLYNSVELSEALLARKVHTVGTLRPYRGEPLELRKSSEDLQKGDVVVRDNGKVCVLAWRDRRTVKALSTKHNGSMVTIERRKRRGDGEMEQIKKPDCIMDYNAHMSGVDQLDQMISYYPCTRKAMRWTKKVFFYLMEITVHNCFILYKAKSSVKSHKLYTFHKRLVSELCEPAKVDAPSTSSQDPPTVARKSARFDSMSRLSGGFKKHHLAVYPCTGKVKYPQRDCRVCSKIGLRRKTRYCCRECRVALCVIPCMNKYHEERQLS